MRMLGKGVAMTEERDSLKKNEKERTETASA